MEKTFIGGYWPARAESINEATEKVTLFLMEVESIGGIFSSLKLPAYTKKKAMQNFFEVNEISVFEQLNKRRKKGEINEQGFCNIGFSISLFNEVSEDVSLSISCSVGASSKYLKNVCYVSITGMRLDDLTRKKILGLIQEIFKPEVIRNE